MRKHNSFTLLEIVFAMSIFAFAVSPIFMLAMDTSRGNQTSVSQIDGNLLLLALKEAAAAGELNDTGGEVIPASRKRLTDTFGFAPIDNSAVFVVVTDVPAERMMGIGITYTTTVKSKMSSATKMYGENPDGAIDAITYAKAVQKRQIYYGGGYLFDGINLFSYSKINDEDKLDGIIPLIPNTVGPAGEVMYINLAYKVPY